MSLLKCIIAAYVDTFSQIKFYVTVLIFSENTFVKIVGEKVIKIITLTPECHAMPCMSVSLMKNDLLRPK
jgi:hypothetical protein